MEPSWNPHGTLDPQDKKNQDPAEGGQRVVTALMYLATPEEGGETVFPDAEVQSDPEGLSDCAKQGLANKPYKGDMLVGRGGEVPWTVAFLGCLTWLRWPQQLSHCNDSEFAAGHDQPHTFELGLTHGCA